jgi:hypothetical protein
MEMLAGELGRATGLGARSRKAGSDAERARLNVTRAVRKVLRKIEAECPVLGRHLDRAVQTGLFCSYEPDPTFPVDWDVESGLNPVQRFVLVGRPGGRRSRRVGAPGGRPLTKPGRGITVPP